MTLKELSLLKQSRDSAKFPSMQIDYIPLYKYTDKTANGLTRAVIDFLIFEGHQAERINTTGRKVGKVETYTDSLGFTKQMGSEKWIKGSGTKGSADISSTIAIPISGRLIGVAVKWEVKMKDKQSKDQKKYQEAIEKSGGYYFIVHNFEEFLCKYNSLFVDLQSE